MSRAVSNDFFCPYANIKCIIDKGGGFTYLSGDDDVSALYGLTRTNDV